MHTQTNAQPEVEALAEALDYDPDVLTLAKLRAISEHESDHAADALASALDWNPEPKLKTATAIKEMQKQAEERMKLLSLMSNPVIAPLISDKFAKYFKELDAK